MMSLTPAVELGLVSMMSVFACHKRVSDYRQFGGKLSLRRYEIKIKIILQE